MIRLTDKQRAEVLDFTGEQLSYLVRDDDGAMLLGSLVGGVIKAVEAVGLKAAGQATLFAVVESAHGDSHNIRRVAMASAIVSTALAKLATMGIEVKE